MLGYVKIDKGELKVREYEIYCGYYCGVCKYIGKKYSQLPRMALSYDAAFLAIMLACLDSTPDTPVQEHCIVHHIRKKTVVRNKAIEYSADVMLILAWYKLIDDVNDENKTYAKATMLLMRRHFNKLLKKYPELCQSIESHLAKLSELETSHCANMDMVAEEFSKIMEDIFAHGCKKIYGAHKTAKIHKTHNHKGFLSIDDTPENMTPYEALAKIGYHMGKWIYMIDAVDDIEENIQSGAYNPLIYRFEFDSDSEDAAGFRTRIEEPLKFHLFHCLSVVGNSLNALDIKKNQGIIENIIYFGLNRKTEEIITQKEK